MAETESWFHSEFPPLARNFSIERDERLGMESSAATTVTEASLKDCVLTYIWTLDHETRGPGTYQKAGSSQDTTRVVLAGIDLQTLELRKLIHLPGYKPDADEFEIFFTMRSRNANHTDTPVQARDNGGFRAAGYRAGERILAALTHAAILCGAKGSAF